MGRFEFVTRERDPIPVDAARLSLRVSTIGLGLWAIYFGAVTFAGGTQRWASPAYRTALRVPGAPESWAAIIFTVGVLILIATLRTRPWRRILLAANAAGFFWCLAYGGAFLREFLTQPGVGLGATGTYYFFAFLFALRTVVFWRYKF